MSDVVKFAFSPIGWRLWDYLGDINHIAGNDIAGIVELISKYWWHCIVNNRQTFDQHFTPLNTYLSRFPTYEPGIVDIVFEYSLLYTTNPQTAILMNATELFTMQDSPLDRSKMYEENNVFYAIEMGNLEILRLLFPMTRVDFDSFNWGMVVHTANNGLIDCFRYLVENRVWIRGDALSAAFYAGNAEKIEYLMSVVDYTSDNVNAALECGRLEDLKIMCQDDTLIYLDRYFSRVDLDCLRYLYSIAPQRLDINFLNNIIGCSNVMEAFDFLTDAGVKPDFETFTKAAEVDNIDIMQLIYNKFPELHSEILSNSRATTVACDSPKAMKFLIDIGAPMTIKAVNKSCKKNNVEVLKLIRQGPIVNFDDRVPVVVDSRYIDIAARHDSIEVVEYLKSL